MNETPVQEPPEVKPDAPADDPVPERTHPVFQRKRCPATSDSPFDLCDPVRIA